LQTAEKRAEGPETVARRVPQAARNVLANWFTYLASGVVSFFLSPFIVRHLGNSAYGIWVLLVSLTGYLGFLDLGIRGAVTRYIAKFHSEGDHNQSSRIVSSAFGLFAAGGLFAVLVSTLFAVLALPHFQVPPSYFRAAQLVVVIAGLNVAVSLISGVFGGVLVGLQRFELINSIALGSTALRAVMIIVALGHGKGLITLALIQLGCTLAELLVSVVVSRKLYPEVRITPNYLRWAQVSLIFSFGLFAFLLQASNYLIYFSDALVIGAFLPVSMVTYFAIGGNLTVYARELIGGFSRTMTPLASKLEVLAGPAKLRETTLKAGRYCSMAMSPIFLTFMIRGHSFIGLWMGSAYSDLSGQVLWVLSLPWLFGAVTPVVLSVMLGISRHKPVVPIALTEGLSNLGLSIALVKPFGVLGVAWGTAIPNLAVSLFFWPLYARRTLQISIRRYMFSFWLLPGLSALPFTMCTYAVEKFWPASTLWVFFFQVACMLPIAIAGIWFFGITREERKAYAEQFLPPLESIVAFFSGRPQGSSKSVAPPEPNEGNRPAPFTAVAIKDSNGLGSRLDPASTGDRIGQRDPLLPDVGVIALVPDIWDTYWQPRHYVLSRLKQYFQIVWLEPAHTWQTSLREHRKRTRSSNNRMEEPAVLGFKVYHPEALLPRIHGWDWLDRFLMRRRIKRARRTLIQRGCRKIILYVWRPAFLPAIEWSAFDLTCYHIDDEYSFSAVDLPLTEMEETLIRRSDRVFVHSSGLLEKKGRINPRTTFVPNGVDFEAYSHPVSEPSDLARIPHPRIGYTGFIKRHLDWPLLLRLSEKHPEWSFVFVGPQSPHPEIAATIQTLMERPNVYFLGAKSMNLLSSYPQHFDVSIMPYQDNYYTKYIYPLKLHEYLAGGKPVVGTRIHTLVEFADVIALAQTTKEWSKAIHDALSAKENSPERREARQEVARQYDWEGLVLQIAGAMAEDLGPDWATRFSQLQMNGGRRKTDLSAYRSSSREQERIANLLEIMPKGLSSILDIGARDGYISKLLVDRFENVTCLDLEKPNVSDDRVHTVSGDVTRLEYPDNTFDVVLCAEVLEHIPPQLLSQACSEMSRVAKQAVVIGVPYKQDRRVGRTTCLLCGGKNPCWGHVNTFDELYLMSLFKQLKQTKVAFVGKNKDYTNALSAWLMDLGGNPWGTYEQEESCVHCGNQLATPGEKTWLEWVCSRLAFAFNTIQAQFVSSKANWIHIVFSKVEDVSRTEH